MVDGGIKKPDDGNKPLSEKIRWNGLKYFSTAALINWRHAVESFREANLPPKCSDNPGGYIAIRNEWADVIDSIVADGMKNCVYQDGRKAGQLKARPIDIWNEMLIAAQKSGLYAPNPSGEHTPINEVMARILSYVHAHVYHDRPGNFPPENPKKNHVDLNLSSVLTAVNSLDTKLLSLRDPDTTLDVVALKERNERVAGIIADRTATTVPRCVLRNETLADRQFDMQFAGTRISDGNYTQLMCFINYCDPFVSVADDPALQEKLLPVKMADIIEGMSEYLLAGGKSLCPLQVSRVRCELFAGEMGPESLKLIMGERRYELIRWDILYHLAQIVCRASSLPPDLFQLPAKKSTDTPVNSATQESAGGDVIADRSYPSVRDRFNAAKDGETLDPHGVEAARILRLHQVVGHRRLLPILRIKEGDTIRFVPCKPSREAIELANAHDIPLHRCLEIVNLETGESLGLFGPEEVEKLLEGGTETIEDLAKDPGVFIRYETYVDEHERGNSSVGEVVGVRAYTKASVKKV